MNNFILIAPIDIFVSLSFWLARSLLQYHTAIEVKFNYRPFPLYTKERERETAIAVHMML
jgi:hypothetical protein